MYEHSLPIQLIGEKNVIQPIINNASGLMAKEYKYWHTLLAMQIEAQRQILNLQAHKLADALSHGLSEATISFPDFLVMPVSANDHQETKSLALAETRQNFSLSQRRGWFTRQTLVQSTQKQLSCLEASSNAAVSAFGGLLRFATARSLIHDCLPIGKEVIYSVLPGEDVPSLPQNCEIDTGKTGLPDTAFSNQFYLPQWVAFGEHAQLLMGSIDEAEACVVSMQQYFEALNGAVTIAPYIVVDQVYRQKYYGILGQLVNQCRSLCNYRTHEIIATILRRTTANSLNRGLWITMPYFDDQSLVLRKFEFEIIPPGRVMFTPAFVIMAVQQQITMTQHNTALNYSTRKHLLVQLASLKKAFDADGN